MSYSEIVPMGIDHDVPTSVQFRESQEMIVGGFPASVTVTSDAANPPNGFVALLRAPLP